MASAFQPRFVDLVRNTTTTQGTGNFVLGPAVSGYSSFAAALQPGDSFYYSALGVDKPAEREVGRGTLLANGTISREAISGALTNFSSGTKTLSLIAPAEWFTSIQSGMAAQASSSASVAMATRAAMAAANKTAGALLLTEPGREGMFIWNGSNLAAEVAADSAQALHVAPSGQDGSTGAWVRQFSGPGLSLWWGVSQTGSAAANTAAFNAALETLRALKVSGHGYGAGGSIGLHTPAGNYQFNGELAIKHALRVTGDYTGQGADGTNFIWISGNTHGFHITKDNGAGANGYGPTIQGFNLSTAAVIAGNTEFHAIYQEGKAQLVDIFGVNWPGDVVRCLADAATLGSNANGSVWQNIMGQSVRWTLNIDGGDTNGGSWGAIGGISCRSGVVRDNSFLGNNGQGGGWAETVGLEAGFPTRCEKNGHIYTVLPGQEAWCSANAPTGAASDNQGWHYLRDDAVQAWQPTWAAGQIWYFSAPFCTAPGSVTNATPVGGVYIEGNCNPCVISDAGTIQIVDPLGQGLYPIRSNGEVHGGYMTTVGGSYFSLKRHLDVGGNVQAGGIAHHFGPQSGAPADTDLAIDNTNSFASVTFRSWAGGVSRTDGYIKSQSLIGMTIEGKQTIVLRTTDDGEIAQVTDGYLYFTAAALGVNHVGTLKLTGATGVKLQYNGADQLTIGNATATFAGTLSAANLSGTNSGDETSGTILAKLAAQNIATSGTVTSSGGKMGYAAGAGGTVTQTTSKSTGVTLNKLCGQITLNAAALAASTTATFVLTNSNIAVGDLLILNHVSGGTAGAYSINAQCGAGTASINVRNVTAGSLSEAIVIGFALQKAVIA